MQEKPSGNRLAIITNAGGPAVIATDALIAMGGNLAIFSEQTTTELNNKLPTNWSHGNPVDLLGDAGPDQYRNAVEICLKDEGVDGVLVILTPQAMTDSEKLAQEIIHLSKSYRKTILASWMGDGDVRSGKVILELGKVPDYDTPEDAVRSFLLMYRYKNNLDLLYETPSTIPHAFKPNTEKCKLLIEEISSTGRYILTENETKEILSYYDMPVPRSKVANSIMEAVSHAMEIGFPVAMKVLSPQVFHKTDIGGQRLNIRSSEEVKTAFEDIVMNVKKSVPNAEILGVLVEEMIPKKYELFIGCKKDPIFGPAIVFGMGGVAVELFNDTAVGLPPMNMALAMQMIERTKIYELLKGFRGMKSVDISAIQFLLYKFAYLVMDFPEIKDIDINPFGVDEKGGIVMDSKIILDDKVCGKPIRPYSHLCISPYPSKYIMPFTLNDNRAITLRPIRPEDEPIEREMFTHFSSETQRFRFFGPLKEVTHQMLTRYTQIDYDREIAIVGILEENGKKQMIGVGRIISDPYHDTAEFAVVVADPWQKLGLGSRLTDYLLEIAKEKKLKKVYAYALEDNTAIIHIFEKRAFQISKKDDGTYYAELNLIPQ
jgi:acetyltransferase